MKTYSKNVFIISLFAGILILHSGVVYAQPSFGIKGGLNLSNLSIEDASDKNMITGLHAGVFLNLPVTKVFSIQPELLFSQKGTKWETGGSLADIEAKLKQSYVDIPF
jgi:hypothetical protein